MGTTNGHSPSESLAPANLAFIESLYEDYLRDPASVAPDWQHYFAELAEWLRDQRRTRARRACPHDTSVSRTRGSPAFTRSVATSMACAASRMDAASV